jgi:hypothetical protein
MLSLYVLGNLLGRLLMAYGIVWVVCLVLARGDWRMAFARSRRWPAVLAVLVLFGLGMAGSLGPSFGR